MREYAFVLEDSLGHSTHALNLKRVLASSADVRAWVIDVCNTPATGMGALPGLRNWSLRASRAARHGVRAQLAAGPLDGLFIHTQVASLLLTDVMRRVPTVISMDATPANLDEQGAAYGHRRSHPAVEKIKWLANRRAFHAAHSLVTWSEWARRSLVVDYGLAEDRVQAIPPGVDTALFQPAPRTPHARTRLLFVGGDFVRKGGTERLAAVRELGDRVELDIVTQASVASDGLPVRVHRLAPKSPELVRLFQEADIFVLPTRGECFAQVIAEAMAAGLPVVATPVAAIPEMVRPGSNGWLVPPRSPRDLAAAIASLVADAALRARFGAASLELARRRHDAAQNAGRILALMDGVRAVQPAAT